MPHLSAPSSVKSSKEDIIAAAEKEVTKSKESLELLKIEGGVEGYMIVMISSQCHHS